MRILAAALIYFFCSTQVWASDETVLRLFPYRRVVATPDNSVAETLTSAESQKNEIKVVKRKGRLYWASREDRELLQIDSGIFQMLIDPRGGGFIKVQAIGKPEKDAPYAMECVTTHLVSICYWAKL